MQQNNFTSLSGPEQEGTSAAANRGFLAEARGGGGKCGHDEVRLGAITVWENLSGEEMYRICGDVHPGCAMPSARR